MMYEAIIRKMKKTSFDQNKIKTIELTWKSKRSGKKY